jgi:hypothetical protein
MNEKDVRAALEDPGYVSDDGFSARVATALPPARRRWSLGYALVPSSAIAGCALAGILSTSGATAASPSLLMYSLAATGAVLLLAAASLLGAERA